MLAIFLVVLYLLERFIGERLWWVGFLTYAPQQWTLLLPLPILIIAVFKRRWKIIAANIALFVFIGFALMGFCWRGKFQARTSTSANVRVMTFNIEHGNAGVSRVARGVRDEHPDVVCFNEVNAEKPGLIAPYAALRRALPEYTFTPENETVVASRLPLSRGELLPLPGKGFSRRSVLVNVESDHKKVTIIATHLATSITAENLGNHQGGLPAYMNRTVAVRQEQANYLLSVIAAQTGPVILCGDFNTPPRGRIYAQLTRKMEDAFGARGFGLGHTFSSTHPVLRIDYIFTTGGAATHSCHVANGHASDHFPLIADIAL